MKLNHVRTHASGTAVRSGLYVAPFALVLGLCLQACGGTGPDGEPTPGTPSSQEKTGQSAQDLTILGLPVPQPVITFGLGDASTKIDPVGTIDNVIPEQGVTIPDPLKPVETVVTNLGKPVSASVGVGDVGVSVTLPSLIPPQLGTLLTSLDPFADGGIQLIGK